MQVIVFAKNIFLLKILNLHAHFWFKFLVKLIRVERKVARLPKILRLLTTPFKMMIYEHRFTTYSKYRGYIIVINRFIFLQDCPKSLAEIKENFAEITIIYTEI